MLFRQNMLYCFRPYPYWDYVSRYYQIVMYVIFIYIFSSLYLLPIVGGVSGAIAKTVTAPIERVKIIIQTQGD